MSDHVIVLGCGPAGLLAAHAVALSGREPRILSKKAPSQIGGAQYLHSAIPGIAAEEEATPMLLIKWGHADVYAKKVYGDPDHPTSWDKFEEGRHYVWNMRQAYDRLWAEYHSEIQDVEITPDYIERLAREHFVVSTIPKIATCPDPGDYDWRQQEVWIRYGEDVPDVLAQDMQMIMSGDPANVWYRQSNFFGWKGVEFPVEVGGSVRITKPVATTYPGVPGVLHLGRYGEWRKDVLVHDVFWRLREMLGE